jgi:hypothetical protein
VMVLLTGIFHHKHIFIVENWSYMRKVSYHQKLNFSSVSDYAATAAPPAVHGRSIR